MEEVELTEMYNYLIRIHGNARTRRIAHETANLNCGEISHEIGITNSDFD